MAIAHRGTGTPVNGINDITPGIHANTTTGDMMILLVGGKPYNASFGAAMAPGWTQLSTFTDGTTAAGVGTGSMFVTAWWKEHDGSEVDPLVDEGATTWNVVWALVMSFSKDAGEAWETPVSVGGGDATAGTGFSVTAGSNPGITAGDHTITMATFRDDAATPTASPIVPTATGATFTNTQDPATDYEDTTGGDFGSCVVRSTVAGTASTAPTLAGTLAAAHTGSAELIRLRVSVVPVPDVFKTGATRAVTAAPRAA